MSTLSFRRFTNAYALREVDPAALIELLRPHAAHLAANGAMLPTDPEHLDIERVEIALLTTSVGELPLDLLDALWHIHEMSTPAGMESLLSAVEQAGLNLPHDHLAPADIATRVWLADAELLRRCHTELSVSRRRSFETFVPAKGTVLAWVPPGPEKIATLDGAVAAWYSTNRRGLGARVLFFDHGDELRFLVRHGGPYRREGSLDDGKPGCVRYRPMAHGVVTFNRKTSLSTTGSNGFSPGNLHDLHQSWWLTGDGGGSDHHRWGFKSENRRPGWEPPVQARQRCANIPYRPKDGAGEVWCRFCRAGDSAAVHNGAMPNLFRRLLATLAASTRDDLRRQIQFLKTENEVLRSRIAGPIRVTPSERSRLVRLGKPLGKAIATLVSIVKPETFLKWMRNASKQPKRKYAARKPGRPRTPEQISKVVLRIARETGFGYVRILGELKKLGIGGVSRSTVVNILKKAGLPTGPARSERTWDQFLKSHAKTLWACDFLTLRVLTATGLKFVFALVFIHPKTRRAHVSASTTNPDATWCETTVRRFTASLPNGMAKPKLLLRDRDGKFAAGDGAFGAALAKAEVSTVRLPHRSPNLNAHVERLIQSIQVECLDHFVILGTRHLDYLLSEYIDYHNRERPHMSLAFATPMGRPPPARAGPIDPREVRCKHRLGGVIKHFYRKAA